jgi:dTDP-4-amino-4,6-dideoxygalactose transaminase
LLCTARRLLLLEFHPGTVLLCTAISWFAEAHAVLLWGHFRGR